MVKPKLKQEVMSGNRITLAMRGYLERVGRLNQGEEVASIRGIIKLVTPLALELHGICLRIIPFSDGKGKCLSFTSLSPSGHGLPYWEPFPTIHPGGTHAGSEQIFPRALDKIQEAGKAAEVRH